MTTATKAFALAAACLSGLIASPAIANNVHVELSCRRFRPLDQRKEKHIVLCYGVASVRVRLHASITRLLFIELPPPIVSYLQKNSFYLKSDMFSRSAAQLAAAGFRPRRSTWRLQRLLSQFQARSPSSPPPPALPNTGPVKYTAQNRVPWPLVSLHTLACKLTSPPPPSSSSCGTRPAYQQIMDRHGIPKNN